MSQINDKSTVPLPWLIAGIAATMSTVFIIGLAYANIIARLDQLQADQWTSSNMELWVEKARQRTNLTNLPNVSEVKK